MRPLSTVSDRMLLTVRMASDGHREWLSDDGRIALVFYEAGSWWSRPSASAPRTKHKQETDALSALLTEPCLALRADHGLPAPKGVDWDEVLHDLDQWWDLGEYATGETPQLAGTIREYLTTRNGSPSEPEPTLSWVPERLERSVKLLAAEGPTEAIREAAKAMLLDLEKELAGIGKSR